jgi:hypothetical protein
MNWHTSQTVDTFKLGWSTVFCFVFEGRFLTRYFQFSLDKAEIGSLSAGNPRASLPLAWFRDSLLGLSSGWLSY